MASQIDFHYPWWLTYGHLLVGIPMLVLWILGRRWKWPKIPTLLIGAVTLWAFASVLIARFGFNPNGIPELPTQAFLANGSGRVLDMGAGTGRSSLMVLKARPQASIVALDLFAVSYEHHFGKEMSGQDRLAANFRAAGLENRAAIQTGDMRKLPFEAGEFDAIVSSYAIDHLNRQGVDSALHEASRVLKPGGEFLLILIGKDFWLNYAFGPLLLHGGLHDGAWWNARLQEAGFQVAEQGTKPITLYFLARRSSTVSQVP